VRSTLEPGAAVELVHLDDVRRAAEALRGVVVRTPLLAAPELAEASGAAEVRLKCENLQRIGAFKARGAYHYVHRLPPEAGQPGVVTYSSGNHGQAVALAAKLLGIRAVVVMPTTAPGVKVQGARDLGAEVLFEGTTSLERKARAEALAAEQGLAVIPPFDHPDIIAGQGTVGLEIVEDWPAVDAVVVPVGGGGLASGVAVVVRALRPDALVYGVEPEGGASMKAALEAGAPVTLAGTSSIADGLLPVRAGELTHRHLAALADGVLVVDDDAIRRAARFLLERHHLVVEYSGAAGVAALMARPAELAGRRVAVVLSGGNLDPSLLAELTGPMP
jgi:threonine dehydratase